MANNEQGPVELITAAGLIRYRVVRSARRKRTIQLRLDPEHGVTVTAPVRASRAEIEGLVQARSGWIVERLGTLASVPRQSLRSGATVPFRGSTLLLTVHSSSQKRSHVRHNEGTLTIEIPAGPDPTEAEDRVRAALQKWYMTRALEHIQESVSRWAPKLGVQPAGIRVANQKRRWGSCSPTGVLRFNWRLVLADPELLDYVVVHELAHLRHMNHSKEFWAVVATAIPGHLPLRKQLRELEPTLSL